MTFTFLRAGLIVVVISVVDVAFNSAVAVAF